MPLFFGIWPPKAAAEFGFFFVHFRKNWRQDLRFSENMSKYPKSLRLCFYFFFNAPLKKIYFWFEKLKTFAYFGRSKRREPIQSSTASKSSSVSSVIIEVSLFTLNKLGDWWWKSFLLRKDTVGSISSTFEPLS